ncbi:MFS transporter [Kutzneria kofuensis]|uniref:DHA2 family multidrug resistance protein-like MFS transporter n=1 Tax=Kutzneria kofuensis TaxID=103725 RepID=A0A7W9KM55_9PSEU|nr:MFS transporter [Kutzneria kofuensis]MBB5895125.1 DHA2 family multidrug resistance protein-like MFS transporter [Kutzneria kofuensis]
MTHATQTPRLAGRREWIGLAVLALPLLLVSMDMTVLYFAIPSIASALQPSGTQQLWMIDMYGFVLAGLLITMGNVGDRIGRRRLLMIGSAIFGLASVTAAFATDPTMLIVARAVQGIGGATLMPSTLALVRNMFQDEKQRRSAIAVWSTALSAGAGLGPVVSGLLLNNFWWGSVFLINVPAIVLLLVLCPVLIPEFRLARGEAGRFDIASCVLSLGGVLSVIWGLKEITVNGFGVLPAVAIAVGLVLGYVFVRRQKTLSHPMINPELFRNRDFGASLTVSLACFFCMIGSGIFTTQYLMEVLHMSPLEAALWTLVSPVVVTIAVPFVTVVARTVRPAYIIAAGFLVGTVGFLVMTQVGTDRNMFVVVAGTIGVGLGVAVALTCITDMVVGAAPAEHAGSAGALVQTGQELGGALGIAVLGSIGAAVYSANFDATAPHNVPAAALDAARQTVAGASEVAHQLPAAQGNALVAAAQEAFTGAVHIASLSGAAVALGTAIFTIALLRRIKPTPPQSAVKDDNQAKEVREPAAV